MSRVRRPEAPVPVPGGACWRRLALTVLGVGGLIGLLGLALVVVVYFLPAPFLVVPVAAALGAVAYVTHRGHRAEGGSATSRSSLRPAQAPRIVETPIPRRSPPAWPTGRHRRLTPQLGPGRRRQGLLTATWAS